MSYLVWIGLNASDHEECFKEGLSMSVGYQASKQSHAIDSSRGLLSRQQMD